MGSDVQFIPLADVELGKLGDFYSFLERCVNEAYRRDMAAFSEALRTEAEKNPKRTDPKESSSSRPAEDKPEEEVNIPTKQRDVRDGVVLK